MPCPKGVLAPCDLVPTGPCYWNRDGQPRNPHLLPLLTAASPSSGPALGGTRVILSGEWLGRARSCVFGEADASSNISHHPRSREKRAECIAPPRPALTPGAAARRVDLVLRLHDGSVCVERTRAPFVYYAYNLTSAEPTLGPARGGTRVEVFGSGFGSNGGRLGDMRCAFGEQSVVPRSYSPKRSSVVCESPELHSGLPPGRATLDVPLRISLNRGADYLGGPGESLRFTYARVAEPAHAASLARAYPPPPPPPPPLRRVAVMGGLLQPLEPLRLLETSARLELPNLEAFTYITAVGGGGGGEGGGASSDGLLGGAHRMSASDAISLAENAAPSAGLDAHAVGTLLVPLPTQLSAACAQLRSAKARGDLNDGYTLVGIGQGALLARAAVEACDNVPLVGKLALLDGPQLGAVTVPLSTYDKSVARKLLLGAKVLKPTGGPSSSAMTDGELEASLEGAATAASPAAPVSYASYLRPPPGNTTALATWRGGGGRWLSVLNNDGVGLSGSSERRARMCAVESLVLIGSTLHSPLRPPRSALFETYDPTAKAITPLPADVEPAPLTPLRSSANYQQDRLCHQTLDRAHRLTAIDSSSLLPSCLRTFTGCANALHEVVLPLLNVTERSVGLPRVEGYDTAEMVLDSSGQLVPRASESEDAFPPMPPAAPPPPATRRATLDGLTAPGT